jgi:hypothetical protein
MKELVIRDSESLSSRNFREVGKVPLIRLSMRRLDAGSAEKGRIAALYTSATKGPWPEAVKAHAYGAFSETVY